MRGRTAYWLADPEWQRDRLREIFCLPAEAQLRYLPPPHRSCETTPEAPDIVTKHPPGI